MKVLLYGLVGVCSLLVISCGAPVNEPVDPLQASGQTAEQSAPAPDPKFGGILYCNNLHNAPAGPGSGCECELGKTGSLTCGFPGASSEITWKFVEHRNGKDVYSFERRFASDSATPSTTAKEVEYCGEKVVVFEDDKQVISILPMMPQDAVQAR